MNYKIILDDGFKPQPLPGRDEWIAALRSGKYQQGRLKLKLDGRYCCLGVKCELDKRPVSKRHGDFLPTMFDGTESCISPHNPIFTILNCMGDFPRDAAVECWIDGMDSDDNITTARNLAGCNDRGFTFSQIADIIEQLWTNA